ncbi:hypothetical protein GOP47_0029957 [Adiantum capillus-veneris]|nr:hypothetical protein GOP47_0029957 [Adiantum capillus-veneris]
MAALRLTVASGRYPASCALLGRRMCMKRLHSALAPLSAAMSSSTSEAAKGLLKVVGKAGAGLLNVDLQAATEFGCLVVNAAVPNPDSATRHVITILKAMRDASHFFILSVMGWGKVGHTIKGLSVRIISDAGGVIDEEALLEALDSGVVAQVVFTEEPSKLDDKLAGHRNVIVTPYPLASTTLLAQEGVAVEVAQEVLSALQGDIPLSAMNARGVHKVVLEYLAPYMLLAEKLGRLMQLATVGSAVKSVNVCVKVSNRLTHEYRRRSSITDFIEDGSHLLRRMIIEGLLEPNSRTNVN